MPWSILHQIASEYLTAIGMRPAQVGYTSWLHGATLLKFLWSPIVDLFGSLRRWMIAMQISMGIGVGVLALLAQRLATDAGVVKDTRWIWCLLVGIGVLSATYDIACDGYYMSALGKRDQARYSGARVAAFRAAMLVGSSGLVFLGGYVNWLLAFGLAGAMLLLLALIHQRFLAEKPRQSTERTPTESTAKLSPHARLRHIKHAYLSFLLQPQALLVIGFLMSYKMADVLMFSMSKVLLARELGIPTDVRGILNSLSLGASIIGAILGGAWIARRSLKRTLLTITVLMAVTEPLFVALAASSRVLAIAAPGTLNNASEIDWASAWPGLASVAVVIVIEQLCGGMATAAQMVFIMRRTRAEHRAAHYAFATAVYAFPQMIVGGYSGRIYEWSGPVGYFWVASALTIPAVVLARFVPTERQAEPVTDDPRGEP